MTLKPPSHPCVLAFAAPVKAYQCLSNRPPLRPGGPLRVQDRSTHQTSRSSAVCGRGRGSWGCSHSTRRQSRGSATSPGHRVGTSSLGSVHLSSPHSCWSHHTFGLSRSRKTGLHSGPRGSWGGSGAYPGTWSRPHPRRGRRCGRHHRPCWRGCSSSGHGTRSPSCSSALHRSGPLVCVVGIPGWRPGR